MFIFEYIYVSGYTFGDIYLDVYIYLDIYLHISIRPLRYIFGYVCMYLNTFVCSWIHAHIFGCVCIYSKGPRQCNVSIILTITPIVQSIVQGESEVTKFLDQERKLPLPALASGTGAERPLRRPLPSPGPAHSPPVIRPD